MRRRLGGLLVLLLAGVFLFTTGRLLLILHRYRAEEQRYQSAAQQFTSGAPAKTEGEESASGIPLDVDFDELTAVNGDVVGWICCEDTVISYPVLHGADNDAYLRRDYRGEYAFCGSIFTDADNAKGFSDANTLVYGHNMKDGTMFSSLENWLDAEFFAAHPTMWLLTPEQNYRIELFSAYSTSALSDTYTVIHKGGEALASYLAAASARSVVQTGTELPQNAHYVVLSTCADSFDLARIVVHGKLVPIGD